MARRQRSSPPLHPFGYKAHLSRPAFCWENLRGLCLVPTASSPPMGGHRRPPEGHPGGLGQAGAPAGQRAAQLPQGVLGVCVPAVVTGAQGWTGVGLGCTGWWGARGWPRPPLWFFVPALRPCSTRANQGLPKSTRVGRSKRSQATTSGARMGASQWPIGRWHPPPHLDR